MLRIWGNKPWTHTATRASKAKGKKPDTVRHAVWVLSDPGKGKTIEAGIRVGLRMTEGLGWGLWLLVLIVNKKGFRITSDTHWSMTALTFTERIYWGSRPTPKKRYVPTGTLYRKGFEEPAAPVTCFIASSWAGLRIRVTEGPCLQCPQLSSTDWAPATLQGTHRAAVLDWHCWSIQLLGLASLACRWPLLD